MNFFFEINIPADTAAAIANCKDKRGLGRAVARTLDRQNELTVNRVQAKLSGEVLHVRTGLLRRSISRTDALVLDSEVLSSIGSNARTGGDSVVYAAIHEFGGQTRPHLIEAKNGKALAFSIGGKQLIRRSVKHPGSKIPERSYLRTALMERQGNYETALIGTVGGFLGGEHE